MSHGFDYDAAFSRNIGWVTEAEQACLRGKTVAIAGLGGVGGAHLLTLARLGVGGFRIADFDSFDIVNFNRQAGALCSTLGQPKSTVLATMTRDINPEARLDVLPEAVSAANVDAFLDGVDLYVDSLDFFAFEARRLVFSACRARGIPAVTAAPLGFGVAFLYFDPKGMSFDDYFQFASAADEEEMALRFVLGLSPAMLQRGYIADPSRVDLRARKGPSTIAACQLCAGVICAEAVKLLLGRGQVPSAPRGFQFDVYRNRLVHTWRPWGNRNPIQRLGLAIARRQLKKMGQASHG
ncbi:ThiF family adenylyltransferase [Nitrogeniibacter mangrovi]|uniref:ThiF family adenylyltransferase n=1 Tax=Nitrogeniibacter mangrovi TaxID=2016596 RepID=A0A6C1B4W5_9RHOO|nr:ThiF family adenylyltransferase [Nitrogeniibacter mangrovi]QID18731.1 ThiF family adenylyltransferase [Nitrogeniibacter mangrovi]